MLGNIIGTGVTNIVGVGMIGATADVVQAMPAGTAKTIAGITPGLQSVALLGPNLKLVNDSFGSSNKKKKKGFSYL